MKQQSRKWKAEGVYREEQRFNQRWLLISVGAAFLASVLVSLVLLSGGRTSIFWALLPPLAGAVTLLPLFRARLQVTIDAESIRYRFRPFHLRERVILRSGVKLLRVVRYNPLLDYGGWGIRTGRKGRAYTVSGRYGLSVTLRGNRRILLGTDRPGELAAFLRNTWTAVTA